MSAEYLFVYSQNVFGQNPGDNIFTDPRGQFMAHGAYAEAGYFLTQGDTRRYNRASGSFDRTVPVENGFLIRSKGGRPVIGRGAVQLLARYSYLDLLTGNPIISPSSGARADVENDITLGVAWYINPQTIMMVNYVRTHIDSIIPGRSGNFDDLGLRFHYDF